MTEDSGSAWDWRAHLGLLASAFVFLVIVMNVLALARYDPVTAAAIVQAGGAANIGLSVAISSAPTILMTPFALFALHLNTRFAAGKVRYNVGLVGLAVITFGYAFYLLQAVSVFLVVGLLLLAGLRRRVRRRWPRNRHVGERESDYADGSYVAVLSASIASMLLLVSTVPWLPTESVSVNGGAPKSAYVVESDAESTFVLDARTRLMTRYDSVDIEREYCAEEAPKLLIPLAAWGLPRYEPCPN